MTFEEFERYIENIKLFHKFESDLHTLTWNYSNKSKQDVNLDFPTLEDDVVELLEKFFDDEKTDYIGYWVYELNFGENYTNESITEEDGTPIKMETTKELYEFLVNEKEKKNINRF